MRTLCVVMLVIAGAGAAPLLEDAAQRSERSANLSHISGTARKIRMYVKNRFLQILPDGAVNGTADETEYCKYTVFIFSTRLFYLIIVVRHHSLTIILENKRDSRINTVLQLLFNCNTCSKSYRKKTFREALEGNEI